MIRGVTFAISVPAHRIRTEKVGELAWMYFDEGVTHEEYPESWLINAPELSKLDSTEHAVVLAETHTTADALRYIQYRRATAPSVCKEVNDLIISTLVYIEQGARRMVSGKQSERGPAWFDLQMANETALKSVLHNETGRHPYEHDLKKLTRKANAHGVDFDIERLADWPLWPDVCDWRYGQGEPWALKDQYQAYKTSLDLIRSAMKMIPVGIEPGFGFLLRYAPWKQARL